MFLVIGATAVILYQDSEFRDSFTETETGLVQERVGTDFEPVQSFITACMHIVARDAVERIAMHGGYVDTKELRANDFNPTSPSANAIHFWPGNDDYKIAYWWHLVSHSECHLAGSCEFSTNYPPLTGNHPDAVDSQISGYVEENLASCVSGFRSFIDQGYEFDIRGSPSVEAIIAERDLVVSMEYPMEVSYGGRSESMNIFSSRLDVDLRNLWDIALNITHMQQTNAFLESQILELISIYSGSTPNALFPPPYTILHAQGTDRRFSWTRSEVRQGLMSVLSSYVPMFSIIESRNFRMGAANNAYDMRIFDGMIMSIDRIEEKNRYDINFDYKNWWDIYLQIADSEIIKPKHSMSDGLGEIPLFGPILNQLSPIEYRFSYDVSYPVLVTVRDVAAFGNDGIVMNFALQSNIKANMPVMSGENEFDISALPPSISSERFCNSNNMDTENIKIRAKDSITGESLSGVQLEYVCGSESCFLGSTEEYSNGNFFEGPFPTCFGGLLYLTKRGYGPKQVGISLEPGDSISLPEFSLDPIITLDAKVKVIGNVKSGGSWNINFGNKYDLRPEESVLLSVKQVTSASNPFSTIAFFSGGDDVTLDIVPGEYVVSAQLTLDTSGDAIDDVFIPESSETFCVGLETPLGCAGNEEEVEYPEIEFGEFFPQGMLMLDDEHGGNWIVTAEDLQKGEVTFYIIASPYIPYGGVNLNHDDLDEFGKSDYYSRMYRENIEPCFGDGC